MAAWYYLCCKMRIKVNNILLKNDNNRARERERVAGREVGWEVGRDAQKFEIGKIGKEHCIFAAATAANIYVSFGYLHPSADIQHLHTHTPRDNLLVFSL